MMKISNFFYRVNKYMNNLKVFINRIDDFFSKKLYSTKKNLFLDILSKIGNFFSIAFFLIIMFVLPFYLTKKIALISFISLFYSTLIVFILKYLIKRQRIYNDNDFKSILDPYSFPSGHISRLSSLIFPSLYILPLFFIFIILPFIVAILRIRRGYHYFTDCVVGYLIGFVCGIVGIFTFKYCIFLEKMLLIFH